MEEPHRCVGALCRDPGARLGVSFPVLLPGKERLSASFFGHRNSPHRGRIGGRRGTDRDAAAKTHQKLAGLMFLIYCLSRPFLGPGKFLPRPSPAGPWSCGGGGCWPIKENEACFHMWKYYHARGAEIGKGKIRLRRLPEPRWCALRLI